MRNAIREPRQQIHFDVVARTVWRAERQRGATRQPDSAAPAHTFEKLHENRVQPKFASAGLRRGDVRKRREAETRRNQDYRHRSGKLNQARLDAPAPFLNLRDDVVQRLHSPASRGAEPQSLIEVAPLDNDNGAIAAASARSFDVPFQIAVEPRPYLDAVAWET